MPGRRRELLEKGLGTVRGCIKAAFGSMSPVARARKQLYARQAYAESARQAKRRRPAHRKGRNGVFKLFDTAHIPEHQARRELSLFDQAYNRPVHSVRAVLSYPRNSPRQCLYAHADPFPRLFFRTHLAEGSFGPPLRALPTIVPYTTT